MDGPLKFKANSSSGLSLLALGAIALASGLYHASSGAVAIGIVLVGTPAVVYLLLRKALRGIAIERRAAASAFEGDTVQVSIRLANRSGVPLFHPVVSDMFAPELHAQKDVLFPDRVEPDETVERTFEGACILPRGIYALGPLGVSISDPFGWFQLRKVVDEPHPIKVYPAVQDFGTRDDLGRCLTHVLSELTHKRPGDSDEFFAVRDYQRGDPLRRVHWGLTAHRGGEPVVREFAKNSAGDLGIFLDRHRGGLIGIGRSSSLEHAVKVAAAVSAHALSRGHRVHLAAGLDRELRVPPGTGRVYLEAILEVLVQVKPADASPLTDLLIHYAADVRPGSTALVMVSPYLYGDERFLALLSSWRRRGVHVLAIVFDALSFRRLWDHNPPSLSSKRFVDTLRGRGIRSYLIPCAADLRAIFAGEVDEG